MKSQEVEATVQRVMVYDKSLVGAVSLSHAWYAGSKLYHFLGRFDASFGASSWSEALDWLIAFGPNRIKEFQFWGHGKWGKIFIGQDLWDKSAFEPGHALYEPLDIFRICLAEQPLLWFRTCETFGANAGHQFAMNCANFFNATVAGHTYIIGFNQSGLHSLRPHEEPNWSALEGIKKGSAEEPIQAKWSHPFAPHTISCLHSKIPVGY